MSDIHVTYDGDTHWLQCFSDDPSAEKGIIVDPIDVGDSWVTLAEKVAEHEAQHGCSPGSEPKPAKVIVVTDDTGRERRYAADEWQAEEAIDVVREGEVIVTYPQGTWRRATVEGAELDSVRPKALRLQSALRQIGQADNGTPPEVLQHIARVELERSGWDEEDL